MLLTTHVIVGASLALTFAPDRPWLAFALAVASHFLIDAVPHGDSRLYERYQKKEGASFAFAYVAVDAVAAVLLAVALLNLPLGEGDRFIVTLGIVGGVLPDLFTGLYELTKAAPLRAFQRLHFFFHDAVSKRWDVPLWFGVGAQAVAIGCLVPLFR